jgi:phytoene dehydrogenase-like protein
MLETFDCVILGGGHNGLTSAAYLAKENKTVLVLEAQGEVGGAAVSVKPFQGIEAKLSRYSYLVSLLPQQIIDELDLQLNLISRTIGSYTPVEINGENKGLIVERIWGEKTKASFKEVTGSDQEFATWSDFYTRIEKAAQVIAPTMLEPLISKEELKKKVIAATDLETYEWLFETPITETIEQLFTNDVVRGVVLTDALIGTFTDGRDEALLGNRCFLYHLIGNGNGEWKVPQGGMGQISKTLEQKALSFGAEIRVNSNVKKVVSDGSRAQVIYLDQFGTEKTVNTKFILSNLAPNILNNLLGKPDSTKFEGCQVKINMLLERLPQLKSGEDPSLAFRGTLHVNEKLTELDKSFKQASAGVIPSVLPSEIYCHTLTDHSILSQELQDKEFHTITLFGLNTPATLFDEDNEKSRNKVKELYLAGLNSIFTEKIEDCLAKDIEGNLCIEVKTPQDIAESALLPRGNIFHQELQWPFAESDKEVGKWGVETDIANIFICGAGAKRGGGVSGIPGRNAALAVLSILT